MNILFTICGRAGSKGVKNKNLKIFLGYPLPFYTVSAIDLYIKNNPNICADIVLNTDSNDLIELFNSEIKINIDVIKRSAELGLDDTPKVDVISNSLNIMESRKQKIYDMIVDLDITSPIRTENDIKNLIDKKVNSDADVVFSVTNSRRNPYFNMVYKSDNGYTRVIQSNINARQQAPEIFDMNASLYAYSPKFLKSGKGIYDAKCDVIKMMDTAVLDIDSEEDFEIMQVVATYFFEKNSSIKEIRDNITKIVNLHY